MKTLLLAAASYLIISSAISQEVAIKSKDPGQWALLYSTKLEKNREALKAYTWEYRVEAVENGQLIFTDLLSAHYNAQGKIETAQLEQDLAIKERRSPLFKAGQEKRLADIEQRIHILKEMIQRYVYMSKGEFVDFFEKAQVINAVGYENALRVDGENVLVKGDSVTLYGDRGTAFPLHLVFSAPYDEHTWIEAEVKFRYLKQLGGFYSPRASAEFSRKTPRGKSDVLFIDITSHNYNAKP